VVINPIPPVKEVIETMAQQQPLIFTQGDFHGNRRHHNAKS
jgi:hypothetical protein